MASLQLEKPLCINARRRQCDSVSVKSTSSRQSHASACAKNLLTFYALFFFFACTFFFIFFYFNLVVKELIKVGVNKNY